MNRKIIMTVGLVCLLAATAIASEGESGKGQVWFGLGGSSVGLLLPDLGATDAALLDRGFGAFGDAVVVTGGRARGGVLGGVSLGGIGWGGETVTATENRYAELAIGFGGIEVGAVVGGDKRSLLTFGAVIGGGGTGLMLLEEPEVWSGDDFGTCGVIPEPVILGRYSAFLAVEPFISFQVQPLHYFGFELHLGYMLPIAAFTWGDTELEGASPRLSGPVIGLSATWGAIGQPVIGPLLERPKLEETISQSVTLAGPCVEIENGVGGITIEQSQDDQVRIVAVKRAHSQTMLDSVTLLIEPTRCGITIHSKGPRHGYWEMEYTIAVPAGTEVRASQAAGNIRLGALDGDAEIELGVGEIEVAGSVGSSLTVRAAAGDVRLTGIGADEIDIDLGTGDIDIFLPAGAAHTIEAAVGIGSIAFGPFEGLDAIEAGGIGSSVEAVLGDGSGRLTVWLGVGEIDVRPADD
jgi:hypothetical protein